MRTDEVIILIAEDEDGHAALIQRNLERAGLRNAMKRFCDGQEVLDFLFSGPPNLAEGQSYVLLLDIRMPRVDGVEVLRRVKSSPEHKRIPVIMLTTTEDPREIARCHEFGCNNYITKPVEYAKFVEAVRQLGLFLMVVSVPEWDESETAPSQGRLP